MCWHQSVRGKQSRPCPILMHDSEPMNDMLNHSTIILSHLLNTNENVTTKQGGSWPIGIRVCQARCKASQCLTILLDAIAEARGLSCDSRRAIPGRLKIFTKSLEGQICMLYGPVGRTGLEDLPGLSIASQLHIEQSFGREVAIEKINVSRTDPMSGRAERPQGSVQFNTLIISVTDALAG